MIQPHLDTTPKRERERERERERFEKRSRAALISPSPYFRVYGMITRFLSC